MRKISHYPISNPILTVIFSIFVTFFISIGIRTFVIDDDFFKMFPKDIESRILWDDMTDEFGDSELLLIAFGEKNQSIFNRNTLNAVRALTLELENIDIVDRVVSLHTVDRIESDPDDPSWLLINKLFHFFHNH